MTALAVGPLAGSALAAAPQAAAAGPTVSAFSLSLVNQGETTYATVTGSGFAAGATVSLGGGIRCQVQSVSATRIAVRLVVAPSADYGGRTLTVTDPSGATARRHDALKVDYAPVLARWAVGQGASAWSTSLVRPSFPTAPTVAFSGGGLTVGSSLDGSTLELTVAVTAHAATGWRTMTLTDGLSTWTVADGLKVRPAPVVTSVTPLGQGTADQGVRVQGRDFEVCRSKEPTLSISGSGVTVDAVSSALGTLLYATLSVSATAPLGPRDVTMTNCDSAGTSTTTGTFAVLGTPTLRRVPPIALGVTRTEAFVGTNLTPTTTLTASGSGVTIDHVTYVSPTRLRAQVAVAPSASLGPHDVTVADRGGASSVATGVLVVDALPTLASLSVGGIGADTTVELQLRGTGVERGAVVLLDGQATSPYLVANATTEVSATELETALTALLATPRSTVQVSLENPDGGVSGTLALQTDPGPTLTLTSSATRAGALAVTTTAPVGAPAGLRLSLRVCANAALTTRCRTTTASAGRSTLSGLTPGTRYWGQLTAPTSTGYYRGRSAVLGPARATRQLLAPTLLGVLPSTTSAGAVKVALVAPRKNPAATRYGAVACTNEAMTLGCVTGPLAHGQLDGLVPGRSYHVAVRALPSAGELGASSKPSDWVRATTQLGRPTVTKATLAGGNLAVVYGAAKGAAASQSYTLTACANAAMTSGCVVRQYYRSAKKVAVSGTTYFVRITAVASPAYLAASSAVVRASG